MLDDFWMIFSRASHSAAIPYLQLKGQIVSYSTEFSVLNHHLLVMPIGHWTETKTRSRNCGIIYSKHNTGKGNSKSRPMFIKVPIRQMYLFTRQLTQNMTTECSSNYLLFYIKLFWQINMFKSIPCKVWAFIINVNIRTMLCHILDQLAKYCVDLTMTFTKLYRNFIIRGKSECFKKRPTQQCKNVKRHHRLISLSSLISWWKKLLKLVCPLPLECKDINK